MDLIFLGAIVAFFVLSYALAAGCAKLGGEQ